MKSPQAQFAIVAIMPTVFYLFKRLPPQQAVAICFVGAWCFLPQKEGFRLPGLPDYTRISATCYSILFAAFLYDSERFSKFKFGWLDVPMLIACLSPFASSISNGLGAYDGFSEALNKTVEYGVPYFIGRIYFNDLKGMRRLAMAIVIGGLLYVPLCLYEGRFYAQVHKIVYGYSGNFGGFRQALRAGGYRPTVFMQHGLSVGMWMMAAPLTAIWLWQAGTLKKLKDIPMKFWVFLLLVAHVLQKSTGAYIYMMYGLIVLFSAKLRRTAIPLIILIGILSFYLYLGVTGNFTGERADRVVQVANDLFGPLRAQSLEFRFDNEELLVEKAQERMIFGWGGWGRNRVYDYRGGELVNISVTDSLWIITYGINGVVGLIGVFGYSLIPAFSFVFCYPAKTWLHPKVAPAAAMTAITVLYVLDCVLNDQYNPVFTLASGGVAGIVLNGSEKLNDRPKKRLKSSSTRLALQGRYPTTNRKHKYRKFASSQSLNNRRKPK